MSFKGITYVSKEVPPKIRLRLKPEGGKVEYAVVKDRILFKTRTIIGTTTNMGYFDNEPVDASLDSYEKTKTLFSIPNAAVILGIAAYARRGLTDAEWEALFHGGAYTVQIQLGGEFVTVDRGTLAHIAGGSQFQPDIQSGVTPGVHAYNCRETDFRWYPVPENKTVPPGENFQIAVNWPAAPAALTMPVNLSIALFAFEFKPTGG